MQIPRRLLRNVHILALTLLARAVLSQAAMLGKFTGATDIGGPKRAGTASFDPAKGAYTVSGGGANMWFTNDALHYVWKKVAGDVSLAADIVFQGTGGDPHRKACLIIRQNLEKDGAYADAALHGDGLTSLQYREANGAMTREIQANTSGPRRLRLEKRGKYVSMSIAREGEALRPAGGAFRLVLEEPFYIGLGVCAHNDNNLETAVFSKVELRAGTPASPTGKPTLISTLETITLSSKDRRVTWWTTNLIEAPNWSRDGLLYFNSQGRIYRIAATGGEPQVVDTGFATACTSNHGLSPDGTQLVISDESKGDGRARIYTLPIGGGTPKRITAAGPSYWHGWSPDGAMLVYGGERDGTQDIFMTPAGGGPEMRLTTAKGRDDGADYSQDGQFIYFNSERTGKMQVWRMKPDGGGQEQITADEFHNWFPHPSPDGKSLVFLSCEPEVKGRPQNHDITLRVRMLATGRTEVIAKLLGGQGTLNVPSWSPDSRRLAFVSYQLVP